MTTVWINVAAVVATWFVTGGFVYGFIRGRLDAHGERLTKVEVAMDGAVERFVLRTEYESRHQDILKRLDRLDSKLDEVLKKV